MIFITMEDNTLTRKPSSINIALKTGVSTVILVMGHLLPAVLWGISFYFQIIIWSHMLSNWRWASRMSFCQQTLIHTTFSHEGEYLKWYSREMVGLFSKICIVAFAIEILLRKLLRHYRVVLFCRRNSLGTGWHCRNSWESLGWVQQGQ